MSARRNGGMKRTAPKTITSARTREEKNVLKIIFLRKFRTVTSYSLMGIRLGSIAYISTALHAHFIVHFLDPLSHPREHDYAIHLSLIIHNTAKHDLAIVCLNFHIQIFNLRIG